MDKKLLLQLCSYLYLFVLCLATGAQQPQQKSGQQLSTVKDVLQDLQKSASGYGGYEEKEEEEGGKGYFSKGLKGGFDKGSKKYGMDEYDKKGNDYGKNGFKKYDMKDKYGNQKYEKKDMNAFGEKWADKNGKENKGKWEEWADNKKWKSDKGKVGIDLNVLVLSEKTVLTDGF